MTIWKIENHDVSAKCRKLSQIYDVLISVFNVDELEAIEADSWSELACIGETYYGEGFTITVCKE